MQLDKLYTPLPESSIRNISLSLVEYAAAAVQVQSYFLPAWNRIYTSFPQAGTGVCYSGTTHEVYPPNRGGAGEPAYATYL